MDHLRERRALIETAMRTNASGLNHGTSGNLSLSIGDAFLITPSGIGYEELTPDRIVEVDLDGSVKPEQLAPSSEWRFHLDIYVARPELGAIVHVHSDYATALACARMEIPAFHYMVARAGGDSIRCATYATFGTQALADSAVAALDNRLACLLANHGMIATGHDLDAAFRLALEVEHLAKVYSITQGLGGPEILSDEEMKTVLERYQTYGRQTLLE